VDGDVLRPRFGLAFASRPLPSLSRFRGVRFYLILGSILRRGFSSRPGILPLSTFRARASTARIVALMQIRRCPAISAVDLPSSLGVDAAILDMVLATWIEMSTLDARIVMPLMSCGVLRTMLFVVVDLAIGRAMMVIAMDDVMTCRVVAVVPVEEEGRGQADADITMAITEVKSEMTPDRARIPVGEVVPIGIAEPEGVRMCADIMRNVNVRAPGRLDCADVVIVLLGEGTRGILEFFCSLGIGNLFGP